MRFINLGKPLTMDQGGVEIPLQTPTSDDAPAIFAPGDGNDGGGLIGFEDWDEELGTKCFNAGVDFMNLTANEKVDADIAAKMLVDLFPSAKIAHPQELVNAFQAYDKAKSDGVTILEWFGVAKELLPAVSQHVPKNKVTDGIRGALKLFGIDF